MRSIPHTELPLAALPNPPHTCPTPQIGTSLPAGVLAGEAPAADAAMELSAPGTAPLRVPLQLPQEPRLV
jgi:hypothetical protein